MNQRLEQKIKLLPENPGVYVMLSGDNQVIYVGKAKVLKNRVKQYFYQSVKTDKVMAMVSNIADFYYIITDNEYDALSLENNLIKKYKPRYNILLKDDKTYPYIKVNVKEDFPRFEITRKIKRDGAKYFGPFMGGISVKDLTEIINQCYSLRTCRSFKQGKQRECLNYHIGLCKAPCTRKISKEDYAKNVKKAIDFLNGQSGDVERILQEKMQYFSEIEEFELAINMRDKLKMLKNVGEKKITSLSRDINADIIAIESDNIYSSASVLIMRRGIMQGSKLLALDGIYDKDDSMSQFLRSYYTNNPLPEEIIVSEDFSDRELVEQYFCEREKRQISVIVPIKGIRRQLADMSQNNAKDYLEKTVNIVDHRNEMTVNACKRLQEILNLRRFPRRIECYDISNISGVDKVASMVVFTNGEKDAKQYRRFMIKTVEGANDFASLQETLKRRLDKLGTDEEERFPKPDLIVIDGGKGQLSAVKEIFDTYNIDTDLISLAKREEEIFTVHSNQPVVISHRDYVLKMLQRIRDEAHRFAITYFRTLHKKNMLASSLDKIEGVGKNKKRALLAYFKTVEKISNAKIDELMKVEGVGKALAEKIYNFYRS
ncbi:MAG: excinuclease ABC subunit UvrC [Christensenellaceae bacterium]